MEELSYQQRVVMEQVTKALDQLYQFNDKLRQRVNTVCIASTAIVGIVTAARFLPKHITDFSVESIVLGLVCLCSILLYSFAAQALLPVTAPLPGSVDTDVLYDEYLAKDVEGAYNNMLIDFCEANKLASEQNTHSAKILQRVIWVLQLQIALLATAIAWFGLSVL